MNKRGGSINKRVGSSFISKNPVGNHHLYIRFIWEIEDDGFDNKINVINHLKLLLDYLLVKY